MILLILNLLIVVKLWHQQEAIICVIGIKLTKHRCYVQKAVQKLTFQNGVLNVSNKTVARQKKTSKLTFLAKQLQQLQLRII